MDPNQNMFDDEINALQSIKIAVVKIVTASADNTAKDIARQCFDHLNVAALFLGQLGAFVAHRSANVEAEVEKAVKAGTVTSMNFPGKTDVAQKE